MKDWIVMQKSNTTNEADDQFPYFYLVEVFILFFSFFDCSAKIPFIRKFHHHAKQVHAFFKKRFIILNDMVVLQRRHKANFIEGVLYRFLI